MSSPVEKPAEAEELPNSQSQETIHVAQDSHASSTEGLSLSDTSTMVRELHSSQSQDSIDVIQHALYGSAEGLASSNASTAADKMPAVKELQNSKSEESIETLQHPDNNDRSDASTIANDDTPAAVRHSTTTDLGPAIVVPRLKRRGLFAQLAFIPEVENAKTYPRKTRWFLTILVAAAGATAPMGTSIFLPSLHAVTADLKSTETIVNLSIALYNLAMAIFPLWWSSFSEAFGRRTIYITSFSLCVVFNALSAISTNVSMLIVMRLLSGGAAASVQAVGAGSIADMWEVKERGQAMSYFYMGPLCGPFLAPIIGGLLANKWGWRSTLWFMVIFAGTILAIILFVLPETLAVRRNPLREAEQGDTRPPLNRTVSKVSSTAVARGATKWLKALKMVFIDPLAIILYLRHLPILLTIYYSAVCFGSLFVLNISVEQTFQSAPYNFSTLITGLLYLPNSLGYMLTSVFGGRWMDNIMHREAVKAGRYDEKGKLIYLPEDRMKENALIGAFLYPAPLIVYGWTVQYGVHWIVPMIANFAFGIGSMLIFAVSLTMLTEFLPRKSSAGVALNNFVRNLFSCVGALVASPIINAIGDGWLFTILGVVGFISGAAVLTSMKKFGPRWREKGIDH